ncbi:hypothetical protein RHMOL_Rhmol06G0086400 [Rhododendron molle]|uniref:Uncharacterized protein n=1 Tax=Rhododendron molle TaxID=49168 RepID=A0ACC0NC83_RHOML|nr:hypothetical protein RHMOL_Rhmol06G0086400 [Rhododendron molle]
MGAESTVSQWSFLGLRLGTGAFGGGLVCCRLVVSIRGWSISAWGVGRRFGSERVWVCCFWLGLCTLWALPSGVGPMFPMGLATGVDGGVWL